MNTLPQTTSNLHVTQAVPEYTGGAKSPFDVRARGVSSSALSPLRVIQERLPVDVDINDPAWAY